MKTNKKTIGTLLLASCMLLPATPALSGPASQAFGQCMVDSMTGKERKELAKWIFFGMSVHPEIEQYAQVQESTRNASNQVVGELYTRLIAEDCPQQAGAALQENRLAFQQSFEVVGRVAMQELMNDRKVAGALAGFEQHIDKEKLQQSVPVNR